jgi:hypothetical protein
MPSTSYSCSDRADTASADYAADKGAWELDTPTAPVQACSTRLGRSAGSDHVAGTSVDARADQSAVDLAKRAGEGFFEPIGALWP